MRGLPSRSGFELRSLSVLIVVVFMSSGCDAGRESSVKGIVTLDGQPLDHGNISFIPIPQGAGAHATIESDGTFSASTGGTKGLDPGEYLLTISALGEPSADPRGGPPIPGKLLTPKKYASSTTSELRYTIQPGSNELEVELHSEKSAKN